MSDEVRFWQSRITPADILGPCTLTVLLLSLASGYTQYSHNLFVEVALEAGWLPGAAFVLFVGASLYRLWKAGAANPMPLAVAVFFVVSATVSGDINDNRATLAALALAWITTRPTDLWLGNRRPEIVVGRGL